MPMSPRLLRPRQAGGFNPKTISGLLGWWDFSDTALMGPTSSGVGSVSNNAPVKYVADKSGNGIHMTQSGADSAAPTLISSGQNGRAVLGFDGGDSLNANYTIALTGETVFQVIRMASGAASFARGFSQSDSGEDFSTSGHYIPILRNATQAAIASFAGGLNVGVQLVTTGNMVIASSQHSGSVISNRINGGTAATSFHTLNKTFTRFSIGYGIGPTANTAFWQDRICETVVYSRSLTDAERVSVTRWLGTKWGITVA